MKHYTEEEILEILKRHKDVSVSYTDEDKQRALVNPSLDEFRAGLKEKVEYLKSTPNEQLSFALFRRFEEDGDRKQFEDRYFNRRQKLLAYALEYWLHKDADTLVHLQDIIWAMLEEYTWSLPAHLMRKGLKKVQDDKTYVVDLFASETAHALSEMLTLVGDDLHPIIKDRIHFEIERRVLSRAYENQGEFFWHNATNNWSAVCAGSVGMTAIYEIGDEERLAHFIERSLSTLENFYKGFSSDGACLEGLSYWNYGFGYFMYFADMLYRRTEGEINLFDDPHVKNIAFFYTKVFFKGSRTVSFSDGGSHGKCSLSALSILAKYYPDYRIPSAEYINFDFSDDYCARFALAVRNTVIARTDLKTNTNEIIGTYLLEDAEWYISSSVCGVGIAAKAGNNGEPHNHNDVGAFLIYKNGESLIADIGAGEYTRQYFTPDTRYTIFCNSSASHSVPIINGEHQKAGASYAAKDTAMTEGGIVSDIAGAYDVKSLKSLRRSLSFDANSGAVALKDSFEFDSKPSSVVERFVSPCKPEILSDRVDIKSKNEKMSIYFEADKWLAKYELVMDKAHHGEDRETYVIDFELKDPSVSFDASFEIK